MSVTHVGRKTDQAPRFGKNAYKSRMSSSNSSAQIWIERVINDLKIDDKTTEDQVVETMLDLIADVPDELINEVAREISRYAVDKQKQQTAEMRCCSSAISTPPQLEVDTDDETESNSVHSVGAIQTAYNTLHEMVNSNREPTESVLEYFRKWPETAFEMDKWGWMLLHHLITRRAGPDLIEAVAKENPDALRVSVGIAHHTPIQLAARCCRSLDTIKVLYNADPTAIRIRAPNGDSAHMLACRAKADMDVRVFLYVNRDGPVEDTDDDDDDMPGLVPISPPSDEEEEQQSNAPALEVIDTDKDFVTEFVRTIGMKEAYPVLVILIAWIVMLTMSLLAGVRMLV